ncbi:flagellar biosynthesis protein FlhA [Polymorphobacter sp. PAMC 29334]|uniref:flagellar biosynthesis protein FlhA n=1 Tax=Polymorphobacter sp. PAMC 29334 TaxID=2862331 RepID=UPI001C778DCA|nr:flagellar biosynthesis protein FlhA [Polymorphobacter sp. PAMC 29334]QYE36561.1 flagellar biosynthesis protein FlhA [Polymorphobacter sp. PAMC 29334]
MAAFALPALGSVNPRAALLPVAILSLVMLMVVPIPPVLLDIFFVANFIVALAVLMVAINAQRPLDFSSFPSVLLFATLLRLALNVASTRVVLVNGHKGTAAAGQVIEAFGKFLIGGDYVVGLFVFAILLIINLVVVTKGAGRVSEVSARFTLDAMPGKQMAIDADLNAGLLTADEARTRRAEVATEADFYGSMDGASKFVKGDAVAGLLILGINIAGGLILGMFRHGLSIGDAASIYLLLAIGDGLVAQIPALLLSIAAAMIVTRVSSSLDLAGQVTSQFASARAWTPIAGIMGLLTLLPGMPHLILLAATAIAGTLAWKLSRPKPVVVPVEAPRSADAAIDWSDVADTATIGLDLGYGLIGMVDEKTGPLMARITGIRRQLSKALGFVVPLVRVRDSIALGPFTYRILIDGVVMAEDEVFPDDLLALEAGPIDVPVAGRVCKDPSFGLDARWIDPAERDLATGAGYTVVDPSTVIGTHLNHILTVQAHLLLGQDETQKLLDTLGEAHPQLVAGLVPKLLPLATVTAVLQRLLEEGVPIRDVRRTIGSLAAVASRTSDPGELAELVRTGLGGAIVQTLCGLREPLLAITFDSALEDLLAAAVRAGPGSLYPFEPALAARVVAAVRDADAPLAATAARFAVVTTPLLRRPVYGLLKGHLPEGCAVLSIHEIPDAKTVDVTAVVGGPSTGA